MIKSSCRLSRTYLRHGAVPYVPRRRLAAAATSTAGLKQSPLTFNRESSHDDRTLRRIFDSQDFWHSYCQTSKPGSVRGLFQNRYLTGPAGFLHYAKVIRGRCQRIVEDVLSASSPEAYVAIPRQLDLLSDSLCRVLDTADFVRANHPDARFQEAATEAFAFLFEYMNILNTTPGLNAQLQKAISTPEVSRSWNEEEKTVAQILLKDFSNSAIDLPEGKRHRFVELSNQIKNLGNKFWDGMKPTSSYIEFDLSSLKGMDPRVLGRHSSSRKKVLLPTVGEVPYMALESIENEAVRRDIYMAGRQSSKEQIQTLEKLLEARAEVAALSGHKSYAGMILSDKMANSPEAVTSFLQALSADNTSHVTQEMAKMNTMKAENGLSPEIRPWDIVYYRHRLKANFQSKSRKPDFMSAYFSLGTVMQGLSRLFTRLYGIRFVPRESTSGETWNPDVRRLDVFHDTEGHVAVLYCDLFARAGKTPNPTHFTLRCSRLVSTSEFVDPSNTPQDGNDGMATSSPSSTSQHYQLPVIALVCGFPHPANESNPTLLTFQDVRTLFHEMGHAIHSILGRTSLQVVAGTRCPTDFAELPSVIMESFAADHSVLSLFARHWETDAPLPFEMVEEWLQVQRRGQGFQTETQILLSLLDQAYHSSLPLTADGGFDSTKVFFDVYDKYGRVKEPREASAQGFFGHLVEYGGTYYSYLFDRAIAGKIWKEVFREGKHAGGVDREAGERFKDEVLRWGGSRSAWACVSGVLRDERLKDGGKEAMEEVGRWGVHD
ncbi:Mitochondrial intermediate peptidase [Mycoblastus sanguinarius]|nr:Mitochondrial intermediate peptidase [Mycoblastus sanguinarius]